MAHKIRIEYAGAACRVMTGGNPLWLWKIPQTPSVGRPRLPFEPCCLNGRAQSLVVATFAKRPVRQPEHSRQLHHRPMRAKAMTISLTAAKKPIA